MKKLLYYIITVSMSVLLAAGAYIYTSSLIGTNAEDGALYISATVRSIINRRDPSTGEITGADAAIYDLNFVAELEDGSIVTAAQNVNVYNPANPREIEPGDRVILTSMTGEAEESWFFAEFRRIDVIAVIIFLFVVLLFVFGRAKGLATAITLALTCFAVFGIFIPAVLGGLNIYLWAFLVCAYIIITTLMIVNGANFKSLSAGLGCIGGVLVSGTITFICDIFMRMTGFTDEHSIYLLQINNGVINLKAILFSAIIIGAVGAIMDVAVNISAALHELAVKLKKPGFRELCASGFTIGRDIMGTMSNTLVLAYIGGSFCSILLVVYTCGDSLIYMLNREGIIAELLQIAVGSLGMLLTIPLTTVICALLYSHSSFKASNDTPAEEDSYMRLLSEMNDVVPFEKDDVSFYDKTDKTGSSS